MSRITGHYKKLSDKEHFVPYPLPPSDPPLQLSQETWVLYGEVMYNLAQLKECFIPDNGHFINAYVKKEAMLSSGIEGIHTTMMELYTQPITGVKPSKDLQLVQNYTTALNTALKMMQDLDNVLPMRVILAAHQELMSQGAGEQFNPGAFRTQSVQVGTLIPALAPEVPNLMSELEKFINIDESLPALIKTGLAHVQFEIIHPFFDGNGRIGRMLIVLMLISNRLLDTPSIYPSYFFKKTQAEYYERLNAVRTNGDFEGWIIYYLRAINEGAIDSCKRIKEIHQLLFSRNFVETIEAHLSNRSKIKSHDVIFALIIDPWITISKLSETLNISYNTSAKLINDLVTLNILQEEKDGKRNKIFKFKPYVDLLNKEY